MSVRVLQGMKTKTRRDFDALEQRRRAGMRLLGQKVAQAEVARRLGVSPAAVCKWNARRRTQPATAWQRRPQGKPPKLTAAHKEQLRRALRRGAQAHGFVNDLWTLPRIAQVLESTCGVRLHPGHLWRVFWARWAGACRSRSGALSSATRRPSPVGRNTPGRPLKKSPPGTAHPRLH